MNYDEIKSAVIDEIDDTPSESWFKRKINEWYEKVISSIKEIVPGNYRNRSEASSITYDWSYEYSIDLPDDCETIDKIDFLNDDDVNPIKIKDTSYDEISPVPWFRWYREWTKVYFRWVEKDYDNIVVHYLKIVSDLESSDDIPDFSSKYHSLLVYYAIWRYYQDENAETDWKAWIQEFERWLGDFIRTIRPKKEKKRLKVFFDDWTKTWHC